MTVIINVPTVGTIRVRRGYREYRDWAGGTRVDHTVTFEPIVGEKLKYLVGSPMLRSGMNPFPVYGTVSAAMDFLDADETMRNDGSDTAQAWMSCAEIPIGRVIVVRDEYLVISDGNGGSDRTRGRQRRKSIRVGQFCDESAGVALYRALHSWNGWRGAGAFDASRDVSGVEPWRTVPLVGSDGGHGVPCVEHLVTFTGDIVDSLDDVSRELKRADQAW